jgi:hypothetical protein
MLKRVAKKIAYYLWVIFGYVGWNLRVQGSETLTVLITYYSPARLRHLNHQIRNLLKCQFVEKIVVSCHNPTIKIKEHVKVQDQRLVLMNQSVPRGCGYRWSVARAFPAEYFVVVDDDIVLFPWQLRVLFERLLEEPKIPHGLSGMIHREDGELEFHQRENIPVHYLTEIYAVTKEHVEHYFEMVSLIEKQEEDLPEAIERLGDFIVISQTGVQNPKIHKAGRIFRDETYNAQGVAMHKEEHFATLVNRVAQSVQGLRPQLFV